MFQRTFFPVILALLVLMNATSVRANDNQDAQSFIQDLSQKAIATVAAKNISDHDRTERFQRLFISAFDIPEIGKLVLGRQWRTATPAQQSQFLKEFETTQVLTWCQRFKEYNGEKLETLGTAKAGDSEWLVSSQILRPNAPPLHVQWRIHRIADGGLRIVDILPQGISMAQTYRQDYAGILQANEGNFDSLISTMKAKNETLSASPAP